MLRIQRNSKGFTLIELLIVIAIIGILAAIALPAYMDYARKAKLQEVTSAMGSIKTAMTAYVTEMSGSIADCDFADIDATVAALGVSIPTKFINAFSTAGDTANPYMVLSSTLTNLGGGLDGAVLILRSTSDNLQAWEWAAGTNLPAKYLPKN
jgi:type IV pilus assembly protein PilA